MAQRSLMLPAILTAATTASSEAALRRSLASLPAGTPVVLDAAHVQTFDSAGLALLLACRRQALAQGRDFQVQGCSRSLSDLAQMYGVWQLLNPAAAAA